MMRTLATIKYLQMYVGVHAHLARNAVDWFFDGRSSPSFRSLHRHHTQVFTAVELHEPEHGDRMRASGIPSLLCELFVSVTTHCGGNSQRAAGPSVMS